MSERRTRWALAIGIALASFTAVALSQTHYGIARDEVIYIGSGGKYAQWWIDLVSGKPGTAGEAAITSHFGGRQATDNNREHPPLMKTMFGFSERVFHRDLGWTSKLTAARLPTAFVSALLIALVFLFASRYWGIASGIVSAALLLLLPRGFFHAGLATFDAPMAALWFAAVYAYHRALDSRLWVIGVGICFGLALATKHNAVMLPAVLLTHLGWVMFRGRGGRGSPGAVRAVAIVAAIALLGPLVLIAVWPWLWFDTAEHLRQWLAFHLGHVHYNFEYLGKNWNAPPFPWHVPIVTTALTAPVATLAASVCGGVALAARALRRDAAAPERAPALLLVMSAAVAIGPFLLRTTPIFGAEKHWAPAMATICIFAGVGVVTAGRLAVDAIGSVWTLSAGARHSAVAIVGAALAALVVAAALAETSAAQPNALASYNALAGGAPGAADLGMNRQFWGVSARGVLPYLDQHAPAAGEPPVKVYAHDASPAWGLYRELGLLAPGLPHAGQEAAGIRASQIALVIHELHFNRHDYLIWDAYGTVQPAFVLTHQGVPLVSVYLRSLGGRPPQ